MPNLFRGGGHMSAGLVRPQVGPRRLASILGSRFATGNTTTTTTTQAATTTTTTTTGAPTTTTRAGTTQAAATTTTTTTTQAPTTTPGGATTTTRQGSTTTTKAATAAASLTTVTPASVAHGVQSTFTLTGTNFNGATSVVFGVYNADSFTVNSATSITAKFTPAAAGTFAVKVNNSHGGSNVVNITAT